MPIVVPPGAQPILPPDTATSPDGLLKATVWPGGRGVLLEANFHGSDGTPGSPEVVNRTNLLTQTGVQGTTVGNLWSVIVMPATLSAVAAAGGQPGYRRVTMTADQTATAGPAVFDSAGGQVSAGDIVSAAAWVTLPRAMAVRVYVFYYNGSSGLGSTYTETAVPANTRTRVAHNNTAVAPAGTNRVHIRIYPVYVAGAALTNGQTWIIEDDVTVVKGSTVGSTFNGATPASSGRARRYTGAAGDSPSQEYTPAVPAVPGTPQSEWPYRIRFYRGDTLVRSGDPAFSPGGYAVAFDDEAPLGTGSVWRAVGERRDGTLITSQTVGLLLPQPSQRRIWLKPVGAPHLAVQLTAIEALPVFSRGARSTLADVPGSRFPTGSWDRRKSREWTLTFFTPELSDIAAVLEALDAGPALLQAHSKWGLGDMYVLPGELEESLIGDDPGRTWTVALTEIDREATLLAPLYIPGRSFADAAVLAPTFADSTALWPKFADSWQP